MFSVLCVVCSVLCAVRCAVHNVCRVLCVVDIVSDCLRSVWRTHTLLSPASHPGRYVIDDNSEEQLNAFTDHLYAQAVETLHAIIVHGPVCEEKSPVR